jgi:hypothetical protein
MILVFICHSQKPVGSQVEIFYGLPNYPIIHSCKKCFCQIWQRLKVSANPIIRCQFSHFDDFDDFGCFSSFLSRYKVVFYTCLSLKRLCFRVKLMTCLRIKAYSARAPKTNNMQANNQISKAVTWLATGMRALYKE